MKTVEREMGADVVSVVIAGVRVVDAKELRAALPQGAVVADLYLGGWRPHAAASQLAARLGVELSGSSAPRSAPTEVVGYGTRIGHFVDAEALGDTRLLHAAETAGRLAGAAEASGRLVFHVIAPKESWEPEDEALVRYLARTLAAVGGAVVLVAGARGAPPASPAGCRVEWTSVTCDDGETQAPSDDADAAALDLLPGVIEAALAATLGPLADGAYVVLDDGAVVIGPERRGRRGPAATVGLSRAARRDEWLRAYAEWAGPNTDVDRAFLMTQAWKAFDLDAGGLALRLADRAARAAVGADELAALRVQTHHMRIALGRFAEVARDVAPPSVLSPISRGLYLQAHGWGLVMVGDHDRAQRELAGARSLLRPLSGSVEYLYLLNITALNLLRIGDVDGALALEREVEQGARELPQRDHRLEYINAINIARLQRRLGDHHAAAANYARAFATVAGVRSESDAVLANFTWAKLATEQGRADLARSPLMRAALHFAASAVPESFSPRLVRTMTGTADVPAHERPAAMAVALLEQLDAIAPADAGPHAEANAGGPPLFMRAGDPRAAAVARSAVAAGTDGWGFLASTTSIEGPSSSPAQVRLRESLAVLLSRDVGPFATAVIDDRCGREIPANAAELCDVALRWRTSRVLFGGRHIILDDQTRERLWLAARVRLGPAVDRLDTADGGDTVLFKRYRAPLKLTPNESLTVGSVATAPTVRDLMSARPGVIDGQTLLRLEEARVVTISAEDVRLT